MNAVVGGEIVVFNIYLINLLRALSLALELSDGGLSRHHWRTAVVAERIASHIALPPEQRQTLIDATLLHDIGAASEWEEKKNLYNHQPVDNLYKHAETGYNLLKDSSHLKDLAGPIRHHHDRWDGTSPSGLTGRDIPLLARIINLADSFEVLLEDDVFIFNQCETILEIITRLSKRQFDPTLVQALQEIAQKESFWLDLTNPHYYETFFQDVSVHGRVRLDIDEIIEIAGIFATIIDWTSRFTASHSRDVSRIAAFLAQAKGYSNAEVKMMRIAGLLHDLGKLTVPKAILEKPGKLTEQEFSVVKQHAYYTYRILNQIDGFGLIAEWAAYHHETLDGTGYPFRVDRGNFRLGSKIVAAADVFTALTEHRPYRQGLGLQEVEDIMLNFVADKKLDGDLVNLLLANKKMLLHSDK